MSRWLGKILARQTGPPAGWFASPTGSDTGDGSIDDPWTLQQATLGGYPVGSVKVPVTAPEIAAATNIVWLRGGTYSSRLFTADMEGTPITDIVSIQAQHFYCLAGPWAPGDVGKNITIYGAGTNGGGANLVTTILAYLNPREIDTVASAGVGSLWKCQLVGSVAYPITFRGYPGERATIDGNVEPNLTGSVADTWLMGGYNQTLWDLEFTNSQVNRLCSPWFDQSSQNGGVNGDSRAINIILGGRSSKVVNCVLHDGGMGHTQTLGRKWESYGNLIYYNGMYAPFAEPNEAVAVDLAPSAGSPVALSGVYHAQESGATSITIASHINAGDYTLVAVGKNGPNYSTCTATFDGTAMTLLSGQNGTSKSVAMFGLAGHTTTANVTVQSNDSYVVRAVAQSFVNVGVVTAGGAWFNNQWANVKTGSTAGTVSADVATGAMTRYDVGNTTTSDTNHMVVDAMSIYGPYSVDPGPSGDQAYVVNDAAMTTGGGSQTLTSTIGGFTTDMVGKAIYVNGAGTAGGTLRTTISARPDANTLTLTVGCSTSVTGARANVMNLIGQINPSNNPLIKMSYATRTGSGTVNMQWGWTMIIYPHGHGSYVQAGGWNMSATLAGNPTITRSGGDGLWQTTDVGATIRVIDAGAAGADLVTTIASYISANSVTLTDAPSANGSFEADWSYGCTFKDNITFENASFSIQTYGSGGTACNGTDIDGNLFVYSGAIWGGLSGYRMVDTNVHDNHFWLVSSNIGYSMGHMWNARFENNYFHSYVFNGNGSGAWDDMVIENNTIIAGAGSNMETDWPTNDYTYLSSDPTTNVITVLPNDYESNRANIIAYNWENLTTLSVDISSAVGIGTPIYVMNARDYYAAPVWTGTYSGGSITLPQSGTLSDLTVAAAIGGAGGSAGATFVPRPSYAPAFAAFIVRAQSAETWR